MARVPRRFPIRFRRFPHPITSHRIPPSIPHRRPGPVVRARIKDYAGTHPGFARRLDAAQRDGGNAVRLFLIRVRKRMLRRRVG